MELSNLTGCTEKYASCYERGDDPSGSMKRGKPRIQWLLEDSVRSDRHTAAVCCSNHREHTNTADELHSP